MRQTVVEGMAVGARDLSAGLEFLRKAAGGARVPLLSANLVDSRGRHIFPASRVVKAGGIRIALIGASPPGDFRGARGRLPVSEVIREAKRLRPVSDVVVVLAAVPYGDALQMAQEGEGKVDFILQSSESRGEGLPEPMAKSFVIRSGERGRQLGSLALTVGNKGGTFADAGQRDRTQMSLNFIEGQMERTRQAIQTAKDDTTRQSYERALSNFQARQANLKAQLSKQSQQNDQSFSMRFIQLGPEIPDDPQLRDKVVQLEPPTPTPPAQ